MFNKSSECSNEKSIDSLSLWTFNYIWLVLKKRFHFKWATNVNQAQPPNEKKFYSHVKMRICVWLCDLIWINQSTKLINISIFPWIQVDTLLCVYPFLLPSFLSLGEATRSQLNKSCYLCILSHLIYLETIFQHFLLLSTAWTFFSPLSFFTPSVFKNDIISLI